VLRSNADLSRGAWVPAVGGSAFPIQQTEHHDRGYPARRAITEPPEAAETRSGVMKSRSKSDSSQGEYALGLALVLLPWLVLAFLLTH
jgi:hypothetical protein